MFSTSDVHENPPPGWCRACRRDTHDLCPRCFICPECICDCEAPAPVCGLCASAKQRCPDCGQRHLCACNQPARDDSERDFVPWEN